MINNMIRDTFLITATDLYNKHDKFADEAYKAYHRLIHQNSQYGESVWALYLLHTHICTTINEDIEKYHRMQEEIVGG